MEGTGNMGFKDNYDEWENERDQRKQEESKKKKFNPSDYGIILNDNDYSSEPAIGRDEEIKKLCVALASKKKTPLLVGESGVGKTAIVDQLAYMIQNETVPMFLQNKIIYEVSAGDFVSGSMYRGDLELHTKNIVEYALSHDAILFIDELHEIRGAGATLNDRGDVSRLLRKYIDRMGLNVIGATTTKEYTEYLSTLALKRRFSIIKVDEPNDNVLHDIAINAISDSVKERGCQIDDFLRENLDQVVDILIRLTSNKDKHRQSNDFMCNPDLIISIIDTSFGYMAVDDSLVYDIKYIVLAINDAERLVPWARDIAIKELHNIDPKKKTEVKGKIYKIIAY